MTIAVTGLGAVTSLGATARATFDRVVEGKRGFSSLSLFDGTGYRTTWVAEVQADVLPRDGAIATSDATPPSGASSAAALASYGDRSRTSALALLAAREALAESRLPAERARAGGSGLRLGLVVGGTTAGMLETESLLGVMLSPEGTVDEAARTEALARMLSHPLSAPTDRLARELGPFTRVRSLSSACSSGANALVVGAAWLSLGLVDAVLCGAADALCRVTLGGFGALGAMDPEGARPFDRRRRGLTLGEGAGFVVLERASDARARGQSVLCTLLGWSSRSEAHHITNPEPTGEAPARAMASAMRRAGVTPADIDWVDAHGTGTPLNDPMEARALARALGPEVERVRVSSQKGQFGHTLAAAGAVEATVSALAIGRGIIPPTGGLEEIDPACPLVHVVGAPVEAPLRAVLSSSFGFGGMDTVLVFGTSTAEAPRRAPSSGARVVVTSAAVVTPSGITRGAALAALPSQALPSSEIADAILALDPDRARRLDRTSRLAAVALGAALTPEAHASGDAPRAGPAELGLVLGSAFGAVDATAGFMRRLREKGPRLVSPADFPSLVPSSPAGHVSIYHGLRGGSLVVADLAVSGEAAFAQAHELLLAGEGDALAVVAAEERSTIVEQVLAVLFGEAPANGGAPRAEGAAALVLATEASARALGTRPLAVVAEVVAFDDVGPEHAPLAGLACPPGRVVVVSCDPASRALALVARSPWAAAPRLPWPERPGTHEATGGVVLAVASAVLARDEADAALVVGAARGRGYAFVLVRPADATACP